MVALTATCCLVETLDIAVFIKIDLTKLQVDSTLQTQRVARIRLFF